MTEHAYPPSVFDPHVDLVHEIIVQGPSSRTEYNAHGAVCERVHRGVDATIYDANCIDYQGCDGNPIRHRGDGCFISQTKHVHENVECNGDAIGGMGRRESVLQVMRAKCCVGLITRKN